MKFKKGDIEEGRTLTGLRPVFKDELTEEHDEAMREILGDAGSKFDFNAEEVRMQAL